MSQRDRTYSIHEDNYRDTPEPEDSNNQHNVYYVPLVWAAGLVNQAYTEKRVNSKIAQNTLIEVCTLFYLRRSRCICSHVVN